jgi:hypothetical protein
MEHLFPAEKDAHELVEADKVVHMGMGDKNMCDL